MTSSTFSATVGSFAELRDDFLRLTSEIVWCTVATVDRQDRPRARILHPYWEIGDGCPIGWVNTFRSPAKAAHLARNPYVSCSYWTPAHDAVFADCRAGWVDDASAKRRVWDLFANAPPPLGYDPRLGGWSDPGDPMFEVLRLDPWRVQVTLKDRASGSVIGSSRVWHAPD